MIVFFKRALLFFGCMLTYLIPLEASSHSPYTLFKQNGKTGLKDEFGHILIAAEYEKLGWSKGENQPIGDVIGYYDGERWGLISLKDRRITAPKYYTLESLNDQILLASLKGRFSNMLFYGTINTRGEVIVEFSEQVIRPMSGLLTITEKRHNKKYTGLYTYENKELLSKNYSHVQHYYEDLFIFTDTLGLKGILDINGEKLIAPILDSLSPISGGQAFIFSSGKVGLIDEEGNILLAPKYKEISDPESPLDFAQHEIKTADDQNLGNWQADSIIIIGEQFKGICTNGWIEVMDEEGSLFYRGLIPEKVEAFKQHLVITAEDKCTIIPAAYAQFDRTTFDAIKIDKYFLFGYVNKRWQIYNSYGRAVSNRQYEDVQEASNNLIPVKRNGYWGFIDYNGNTAIHFKYDRVTGFQRLLAQVEYLGYKNLINQFGEVVGEASYDSIVIKEHNRAVVKTRSRTDILNEHGSALFQTYNKLIDHEVGYLEKTEGGLYGLIDFNGRIIFYPNYDSISPVINDRFLIIQKEGKTGVSLTDGSFLISPNSEYQSITNISEGRLAIQKNNQFGFIDFDGLLRVANRYDSVKGFSEGHASVKLHGHWGMINTKEEIVVQPNFDKLSKVNNGLAVASRNGEMGIVNTSGHEVLPVNYEKVSLSKTGHYIVEDEGKLGLYGMNGEKILSVAYDRITPTQNGYLIVERRGKTGLMNKGGLYTIPLKYDTIKEIRTDEFVCKKLEE